jgi:hypothetical protein
MKVTYTTTSRVRGLFGFSEKDVGDTPLEELIEYVDKEVDLATGTTWDGAETYYPIVQEAAAILVASLVYKRFRDQQQTSKKLWEEGQAKLKQIGETTDGVPFMAYQDPLTE